MIFTDGNSSTRIPGDSPEEYSEIGYLIVRVYTARGAIPVEGALVTINPDRQDFISPYAVLTTDKSGKTIRIELPAPPRNLSLRPERVSPGQTPATKPYALYNIEIVKEGFYPVTDIGAQVFSGITAIQNANLLSESESLPATFYRDGSIYVDETREDLL